jgi:hypothetical protein
MPRFAQQAKLPSTARNDRDVADAVELAEEGTQKGKKGKSSSHAMAAAQELAASPALKEVGGAPDAVAAVLPKQKKGHAKDSGKISASASPSVSAGAASATPLSASKGRAMTHLPASSIEFLVEALADLKRTVAGCQSKILTLEVDIREVSKQQAGDNTVVVASPPAGHEDSADESSNEESPALSVPKTAEPTDTLLEEDGDADDDDDDQQATTFSCKVGTGVVDFILAESCKLLHRTLPHDGALDGGSERGWLLGNITSRKKNECLMLTSSGTLTIFSKSSSDGWEEPTPRPSPSRVTCDASWGAAMFARVGTPIEVTARIYRHEADSLDVGSNSLTNGLFCELILISSKTEQGLGAAQSLGKKTANKDGAFTFQVIPEEAGNTILVAQFGSNSGGSELPLADAASRVLRVANSAAVRNPSMPETQATSAVDDCDYNDDEDVVSGAKGKGKDLEETVLYGGDDEDNDEDEDLTTRVEAAEDAPAVEPAGEKQKVLFQGENPRLEASLHGQPAPSRPVPPRTGGSHPQ